MAETLKSFFTSFGHTEQRRLGAKPTPDLSHIKQNLTPKPRLSLKKTNNIEVKVEVEVKEGVLKAKANEAMGYDNISPREIMELSVLLPFQGTF